MGAKTDPWVGPTGHQIELWVLGIFLSDRGDAKCAVSQRLLERHAAH
jgi:hypothetical protein